jgi:regulatory protein
MDSLLYEKLVNAALRFVSYRPRSEKEIKDYLSKSIQSHKITSETETSAVFKRMQELGYADDFKFASWWIEARISTKPKGIKLIKYELAQKGVKPEVVSLAMEKLLNLSESGNELELNAARKAVKSKVIQLSRLPIVERKNKLFGYLNRRGFSADVIRSVIDENYGLDYNTNQ